METPKVGRKPLIHPVEPTTGPSKPRDSKKSPAEPPQPLLEDRVDISGEKEEEEPPTYGSRHRQRTPKY